MAIVPQEHGARVGNTNVSYAIRSFLSNITTNNYGRCIIPLCCCATQLAIVSPTTTENHSILEKYGVIPRRVNNAHILNGELLWNIG